jgi:hypothetical protein
MESSGSVHTKLTHSRMTPPNELDGNTHAARGALAQQRAFLGTAGVLGCRAQPKLTAQA